MIRVPICVAAEGVSVDQVSNRVTLFNIFDHVAAPGFPVMLSKVSFFALFERDLSDEPNPEMKFSIRLDDEEITSSIETVEFGKGERGRVAIQLTGMPLMKPGLLSFIVFRGNTEISRYSFRIIPIPASLFPKPAQTEAKQIAADEAAPALK